MRRLFHPLLFTLVRASLHEMARQIEYLRAENEMLRSGLTRQIRLTTEERLRLIELGRQVGPAIRHLVTIVNPRTFARWLSGEATIKRMARVGRPRTPEQIREIIIRIASETGWGYTRILAELKKLGIRSVSRTTVANILKGHGFDPRGGADRGRWNQFIRMHAETLWACDFFSKKIWTRGGLVEYFVLFVINVKTRCVHITSPTAHPNAQWVTQQAKNFIMQIEAARERIEHLIRDNDGKYQCLFDLVLETDGIEVHTPTPLSPNLNAYAERWVQTIKHECLNHFVILGERHMNYLVQEFVKYYNTVRPHQAKGNVPLPDADQPCKQSQMSISLCSDGIRCESRLGGLLRHYYRVAA